MKLHLDKEYELDRCYSIAPLTYQGKNHILVAAEKVNKCLLFDTEGNLEDVVWDGPGGTMSMVQVPGKDGWFLATHKFYSPNDSAEAKIVLVRPVEGKWVVTTVKDLPFTHRFQLVQRDGQYYLIACTIKSKHEFKDDWNHPGKVYVCKLPDDLENYNEDHQLEMEALIEGLTKNHGYCNQKENDYTYALIGSESGVHKVVPPVKGGEWTVTKLIDEPTSDMFLADFDNDGKEEMITISPFHGDDVHIYHLNDGKYEKVWSCPFKMEMSHSIWARDFYGKDEAIIGYRKGERDIVEFYYQDGEYKTNILMHDVGSANIYPFEENGKIKLVSTNRETNQIAFYTVEN